MKRFFLLFAMLMVFSGLQAEKTLQAYLSYTSFNVPGGDPYVETYLSVAGNSINYQQISEGKFQGVIEVVMLFKQEDEIVNYDKYDLKSPVISDTTQLNFDILDQHRYTLKNGSYDFEIWLSDKHSEKKPFIHSEPLTIKFPEKKIAVSGIQLLASYEPSMEQNIFTKSGYDLKPYVSNFIPDNMDRIMFYAEIYNTDQALESNKYLLDYYIESFETARKLVKYETIKRQDAADVTPILSTIDIANLPSGNYKLVIEARDKDNQLIAFNKLFFQRSNPDVQFDVSEIMAVNVQNTFVEDIDNLDTLKEYIRSLAPISSEIEKQFAQRQFGKNDLTTMQQYFLNFWLARDNLNPARAWMDYKKQVEIVNEAYGTQVRKGYDTDRGRVYLKYGPPNIITESYNEPHAYPYEIWHYYTLSEHQRDKKFVFMAHDMVTNNFELIHSNALGELSNYKWQILLHRRNLGTGDVDERGNIDAWGNKAGEYYNEPF